MFLLLVTCSIPFRFWSPIHSLFAARPLGRRVLDFTGILCPLHISPSPQRIAMVRRVLVAQLGAFLASAEMAYAELLSSTAILPTGCTALNSLLDCGLYTGELTEITGAPGTGKTQVCACVAVSVACDLKQRVFYIDTTGSLSPSLLLCLTQAKLTEPSLQASALQRIEIVKAFDAFSVLDEVEKFQKRLSEPLLAREEEVRVLLLDSVFSVFSPLFGSGHADGQSFLMHLARQLKFLAKEYNLAVVVTNGVLSSGREALGRAWSHVPNVRISLSMERSGPPNKVAGQSMEVAGPSDEHACTDVEIEDDIVRSDVEMAEMEENIEIDATDDGSDRHVKKFERIETKDTRSESGGGVNSVGDIIRLGGTSAASGGDPKSLRYAKLTKSTRQVSDSVFVPAFPCGRDSLALMVLLIFSITANCFGDTWLMRRNIECLSQNVDSKIYLNMAIN
uniref:RAD51 paralog D n=1 Tax=Eptatretus burgeri TaxID=7764 RepID=A0A8C4Q4V7_EPTBU